MKRHRSRDQQILLASALLVGFTAAACGNGGHSAVSSATHDVTPSAGAPSLAPATQQVSLTGCLQEGTSGGYILTELNEPKHPDSSSPSVVEHQKLAAADEAYRLTSHDDELSKLIGNRVHVDGTLSERSDLVATMGTATGTAGESDRAKAVESGHETLREGDLAEVKVSSLRKVANSCGGRTTAPKQRAARR